MTEMPGLSDMQILSILEVHYIVDMCSLVEKSHPFRDPFLQLLELVFEGFKDEILAQPREFDLSVWFCDNAFLLLTNNA